MVIGAPDILFVVLAVDVLGRGQGWVGYLSMAYGAGGVLIGLAGMALHGRIVVAVGLCAGPIVAAAVQENKLLTVGSATRRPRTLRR